MMRSYGKKKRVRKLVTGFHPAIHARNGLMLGIRQPLDGAVFRTRKEADNYCIHVMTDHFDRRLGPSDAMIHPFKGLVSCGLPPDPDRLRDITRICEQVAKERKDQLPKTR